MVRMIIVVVGRGKVDWTIEKEKKKKKNHTHTLKNKWEIFFCGIGLLKGSLFLFFLMN